MLTGLVLTGGGARAAYQAGALKALAEIVPERDPFQIVTGVSAGAINAASLASDAPGLRVAAARLWDTWAALTPESVYRTDLRSLSGIGARWARDISTGGLFGPGGVNHLLDTSPLRALLAGRLPLDHAAARVAAGTLHGFAVSATNYLTGTATTFFAGAGEIAPWTRTTRIGLRTTIGLDHVLASASIPIFFPPVRLGDAFFGDGCVRMTAPLSPAIHLGASRLVAIGIRYFRDPEQTIAMNRQARSVSVPLAQIGGVLLNAVFLDSLEADLERVERINRTLTFIPAEGRGSLPLRHVPVLALRPSVDLGGLAAAQYDRFPRTLRYLLRGIGATRESGWDLVSYLAFEPHYIGQLLSLGYRDTMARKDEIAAFFTA